MSCGCNNGIPNEVYDRMPYMRQTPTHHHCCPPPPPLFMPFQPPPWFGPCFPPPPRQAGPWEYTPSRMYPGPPPCGCGPRPHIPPPYPHFWPHPWHQPYFGGPTFHYQCMPQQAPVCGCMGPIMPMPHPHHDCGCHLDLSGRIQLARCRLFHRDRFRLLRQTRLRLLFIRSALLLRFLRNSMMLPSWNTAMVIST